MRKEIQKYIKLFHKSLDMSGICWWIIDFEENPEYFYCNDFMKDIFALNKSLQWHCVEDTCPIAGDYNKNVTYKDEQKAKLVIHEYKQLINLQTDEYNNKFPYYSKQLNKILYFSSRAKILEITNKNEVSILYGIIEDITTQEELKQELEKLSIEDKLTSIYNRAKLDELLNNNIKLAKRYNTNLSLIMIDIDYFKLVNDTHGHLVGDKVLVQISTLLKNNIRESDIIGRWGGEEFLIICPSCDINSAKQLAEKLRSIVEKYEFDSVKNKTASFGVSQFKENDDSTSLLECVDNAMYQAKKLGRNRVEVG